MKPAALPNNAQPNLSASQEHSSPSTPMFVWSFFMNVPDNEPRKSKEVAPATPHKCPDDRQSTKSRTPMSLFDKMTDFSPFRTTCQKRFEISPVSPGMWKKANSSLKKTKQNTETHFHNLFQNSDEKDTLVQDTKGGLLQCKIDSLNSNNEFLLFPDLDRSFCEPFGQSMAHPGILAQPVNEHSKARALNENREAISNEPNNEKEKDSEEGCNCRNTKCLKLYCECLRKGLMCGPTCNCVGCENHFHSEIRAERVKHIEKKNPNAFKPIIVESIGPSAKVHNKGCNCRRSHCLKNYCECHQFGVKCTEACKCYECKNTHDFRSGASRQMPKRARNSGKAEEELGQDGFIASPDFN
jgi:hypothetical protein